MSDNKQKEKISAKSTEQAHMLYQTGLAYENGTTKEKDEKEAVKYYKESAELGNPYAQCRLGYCYEKSIGVDRNINEAIKYYQLAVAQDDAIAQHKLAEIYCYGRGGTTKDRPKAYNLYKLSARSKNQDALYRLAQFYDGTLSSETDDSKALECYLSAAQLGHKQAQYFLPTFIEYYFNTSGSPSDIKEKKSTHFDTQTSEASAKPFRPDEASIQLFINSVNDLLNDEAFRDDDNIWLDYLRSAVRIITEKLTTLPKTKLDCQHIYRLTADESFYPEFREKSNLISIITISDKNYAAWYEDNKIIAHKLDILSKDLDVFIKPGQTLKLDSLNFERIATLCNYTQKFTVTSTLFLILHYNQAKILEFLLNKGQERFMNILDNMLPIQFGAHQFRAKNMCWHLISRNAIASLEVIIKSKWRSDLYGQLFEFSDLCHAVRSNAEGSAEYLLKKINCMPSQKQQLADIAKTNGNIDMLNLLAFDQPFYFFSDIIDKLTKEQEISLDDFFYLISKAYRFSTPGKVDQLCHDFLTYLKTSYSDDPKRLVIVHELENEYAYAKNLAGQWQFFIDRYTSDFARKEVDCVYAAETDKIQSEVAYGQSFYRFVKRLTAEDGRNEELKKRAKEIEENKSIPRLPPQKDIPISLRELVILAAYHHREAAKKRQEPCEDYIAFRTKGSFMTPFLWNRYGGHMVQHITKIFSTQKQSKTLNPDASGDPFYTVNFENTRSGSVHFHPHKKDPDTSGLLIEAHWCHGMSIEHIAKIWPTLNQTHNDLLRMSKNEIEKNPEKFYELLAAGEFGLAGLTLTARGNGTIEKIWMAYILLHHNLFPLPAIKREHQLACWNITAPDVKTHALSFLDYFEQETLPLLRPQDRKNHKAQSEVESYEKPLDIPLPDTKTKAATLVDPISQSSSTRFKLPKSSSAPNLTKAHMNRFRFSDDTHRIVEKFYTAVLSLNLPQLASILNGIIQGKLKRDLINGALNKNQKPPLILAAQMAQTYQADPSQYEKAQSMVTLLLDHGADRNEEFEQLRSGKAQTLS